MSQPTMPSSTLHIFARAVLARLTIWPALRLAVQQSWGGPESNQKRIWMAGVIVDAFDLAQRSKDEEEPDDYYVEEQLLQMMSDEFDVTLEDGSAEGVARDVVRIWTGLNNGENGEERKKAEETIERWEGQALKIKGKVVEAVVEGDDEVGGSEGDDDDWEDESGSEDSGPELIDPSKQRQERVVDDEGFTLVQGRGKGKSHK